MKNSRMAVLIFVTALVFPAYLAAAEAAGSLEGVVKNAAGSPMVGALVRAKNENGLSVTVVSEAQGQYKISNLPAGKYTVQTTGDGLQSDSASVEIDGAHSVTQNLTANAPGNFRKTDSMAEYSNVLPAGKAKQIMMSLCTDCHKNGLQEIVYSHKDRDGWDDTIEKMRNHPYGYFRSLDITDEQKQIVLDMLSKTFTPDSPSLDTSKLPKSLLKGEALKGVVTEFDLPAGAGPHDVAVDAKGIGWVSEGGHGVIGRYDPVTATYKRIPLPGSTPSGASAIAVDPKGHVWAADSKNSRLVEYDPETEKFTTYAVPTSPTGSEFNTIRFHPDGTVWATQIGANQVLHLNPATREMKVFPFPSPNGAPGNPYGMAIDPSGAVWLVEAVQEKIARIDPETGKIMEINNPRRGERLTRMRRMQADANGNIWIGEFGGMGKLLMVDSHTNKLTEFDTPTEYAGPYSVDVDKAHDLIWFNEMMADQIVRFDPRAKTFSEFRIPTINSSVRRIELDPSKSSRIWFSGLNKDTVGYLDVTQ